MVEDYLQELANEEVPLQHSGLIQLSSASEAEIEGLEASWTAISTDRRREIADRMLQLAEDNPELDYDSMFLFLMRDPDPDLRSLAARGLWECEDRVVIRPLVRLLTRDPSAKVRSAAATSLGHFARLAAEGKLADRDTQRVRESLMGAVTGDGEEPEVARRATEAVAAFGTEEIAAIIRRSYLSDDVAAKRSAIFAMGRTADPAWLPSLIESLDSAEATHRHEAALACGQIGTESAVPYLIALLNDSDGDVEIAVVQSLGAIGGQLAKRALAQCLKSDDEAIAAVAREALNEIEAYEDPLSFDITG